MRVDGIGLRVLWPGGPGLLGRGNLAVPDESAEESDRNHDGERDHSYKGRLERGVVTVEGRGRDQQRDERECDQRADAAPDTAETSEPDREEESRGERDSAHDWQGHEEERDRCGEQRDRWEHDQRLETATPVVEELAARKGHREHAAEDQRAGRGIERRDDEDRRDHG